MALAADGLGGGLSTSGVKGGQGACSTDIDERPLHGGEVEHVRPVHTALLLVACVRRCVRCVENSGGRPPNVTTQGPVTVVTPRELSALSWPGAHLARPR